MEGGILTGPSPRLLHVIVGHKFPNYFENATKSVLRMTVDDDILVVDNASNDPMVTSRLLEIAHTEPRVRLILRSTNDISKNSKVGGLYDAYNEVMSYALDQGYDYTHIMQHDMQMLWWDSTVTRRAQEIFTEYPTCVNIQTLIHYQLIRFSDDLEYLKPKLMLYTKYGLTDTGLYDMAKWRAQSMRFGDREQAHASEYLQKGFRVFCHPLPTVAPIPWPAVVRGGKILGREIQPRQEFLLRPLSTPEIARVMESADPVWFEDVGVPWGWSCLTPYWVSDLRSINYLVYLYRSIRRHGLRAAWPTWERRGLAVGTPLRSVQRQPRLGMLAVITVPVGNLLRQAIKNRR